MTDVTENQDQNEDLDLDEMTPEQREQAEKTMLRDRLTKMGVRYSNNAGLEALREKLKTAMEESPAAASQIEEKADEADPVVEAQPLNEVLKPAVERAPDAAPQVAPAVKKVSEMNKQELAYHLRRDQLQLVRVKITNLDPKKREWPGEILTFANEYVGTVSRFVPFGELTDEGWHIEKCLYQMMKDKQFLDIQTKRVNGQIIVSHRLVREFSLEVLEPLTQNELQKLGQAQLAAGTSSLD